MQHLIENLRADGGKRQTLAWLTCADYREAMSQSGHRCPYWVFVLALATLLVGLSTLPLISDSLGLRLPWPYETRCKLKLFFGEEGSEASAVRGSRDYSCQVRQAMAIKVYVDQATANSEPGDLLDVVWESDPLDVRHHSVVAAEGVPRLAVGGGNDCRCEEFPLDVPCIIVLALDPEQADRVRNLGNRGTFLVVLSGR